MENKYFTPDIEDLCIGYECEYNFAKAYTNDFKFVKIGYKDDEGYTNELTDMIHLIDDGAAAIRVPYLTREQIEAEGWYKINNNYPIQTFKHPINVGIEVIYNYDTNYLFITIPGKIMFTEPNIEYRASKFSGECKDINTFRKICKLLGI